MPITGIEVTIKHSRCLRARPLPCIDGSCHAVAAVYALLSSAGPRVLRSTSLCQIVQPLQVTTLNLACAWSKTLSGSYPVPKSRGVPVHVIIDSVILISGLFHPNDSLRRDNISDDIPNNTELKLLYSRRKPMHRCNRAFPVENGCKLASAD